MSERDNALGNPVPMTREEWRRLRRAKPGDKPKPDPLAAEVERPRLRRSVKWAIALLIAATGIAVPLYELHRVREAVGGNDLPDGSTVCNQTEEPFVLPAGNGHCYTEMFPPDSCYKVMWRGWARDCWYAGREVKR